MNKYHNVNVCCHISTLILRLRNTVVIFCNCMYIIVLLYCNVPIFAFCGRRTTWNGNARLSPMRGLSGLRL